MDTQARSGSSRSPEGRRVRPGLGRAILWAIVLLLPVTVAWGCDAGDGAVPDGGGTTTGPGTGATSTSLPADGDTTTTGPAVSTTVPYASTTTAPPSTTTSLPPRPTVTMPGAGLEYSRLPGDERVVALTFDAAYEPAPLAAILEALDEHGAPATFFLTGEFVEDFPDEVQAVIASGRPIGGHSYSHPDFTTISDEQIDRQMSRTAELLVGVGARDPRPLFRFPYGARDRRTLARVGSLGYVSVFWTIDTLDWKPERTPEQIRRTVLDDLEPGAIVLMHVGSPQTAEILPRLLDDLSAAGYGFVDLRSALPAVGD